MIRKIFRILGSIDYYLLSFFKNRIGLNNFDIEKNGEKFIAQAFGKSVDKPIIFDVGANVGNWTELILDVNEKSCLYLFDANPAICESLEKKFCEKNVTVTNTLVSNDDEKHDFYISESNNLSGASSMYEHYYLMGKSNKISIESITIDAFCELNGITRIDFLKADIEGAELSMLEGAKNMIKNQSIGAIQLEYNQTWIKAHSSLKDIFDICEENQYKLYRIMPNALMSLDYYHYIVDDFNYQNLLMVSSEINFPVSIIKNVMPEGVY